MNEKTLISPLDGTIVPLDKVPDPVFSQRLLGNGVAIFPASQTVFAPISGTITNINPARHALVITHEQLEFLIHVGLESVELKGEGFELFVQKGQSVTAGQKLLSFDLNVLTKKAASPLVLLVVTAPADTPVTLLADERIKTGLPLLSVHPASTQEETLSSTQKTESAPIKLLNSNGIHARPAAVLARLAANYPYQVDICTPTQRANAKSIVELMGLGLAYGDEVTIHVFGPQPQAQALLVQLQEAFQNGFGELKKAPVPQKAPSIVTAASDVSRLSGLCACGGLAYGPAYVLKKSALSFEEDAANPQAECQALDNVLHTLSEQMEKRIAAEKNAVTRDILNAHLLLLKDPLLADTTRKTIQMGKTAAFAFNSAIRRSVDILKQTNNRFLMERIADLKDLRREVLCQLTGQQRGALHIPSGSIIVAEELLPSDVSALPADTAGVLLAGGSPTAHAGILLRNRNIPALVQSGAKVLSITDGTLILLDADRSQAVVAPTQEQLKDFQQRISQLRQRSQQEDAHAHEPAVTKDDIRIFVPGNISGIQQAVTARKAGAEGFGLVRTEFLFQDRAFSPTEDEQLVVYQAILDASPDYPVTFRLLDAGGDKPMPFISLPQESNPIVGVRGVRAARTNEEFFRTQIRALLRLNAQNRVHIMLPMVSFSSEITFFRQLIEQTAHELGLTQTAQLGIMIEVPCAALTAKQLAQHADFFSIGTNDLTQYTLAIDRGHKELSPLADALHPAVLQLIWHTCQGAQAYQKPVAVCGATAAEPAAVPLLIGLGVTSLAVNSGAIARTKAIIRQLTLAACQQTALEALQQPDAQAVRALVKKRFSL
ncbi:MAG: phosphoenolpyruvate--protein phosphotransferase [Elusimicrobiaceae bacterium]|nr:phosphoenolpyruvate--protein phosphotransferase [Elusimicrobiaceae bacterium]